MAISLGPLNFQARYSNSVLLRSLLLIYELIDGSKLSQSSRDNTCPRYPDKQLFSYLFVTIALHSLWRTEVTQGG